MFEVNKAIKSAIEMTEKDGITRYIDVDSDIISMPEKKQIYFKIDKSGVVRGYINGVSGVPIESAIKQPLDVYEHKVNQRYHFMAGWDYSWSPVPLKSVGFYWQGFQITDEKIIQEQWVKMKKGASPEMIAFISEYFDS